MKMPEYIKKLMFIFPNSFINYNNELILDKKYNVYFRLDDVESKIDVKCKLLNFCSRPAVQGASKQLQNKILKGINEYLETNFTNEDMMLIYTKLGNGCNKELTRSFLRWKCDLTILGKNAENKGV